MSWVMRRVPYEEVEAEVVEWETAHNASIAEGLRFFKKDGVLIETEEFFQWARLRERWALVNGRQP